MTTEKKEFVAIYRSRSDGDWDFVAMFSRETYPLLSQADTDQVDAVVAALKQAIEDEGDVVLIQELDDPESPMTYDAV